METVSDFLKKIQQLFQIPRFTVIDVVEVIIIAFLVYQIVRFVRSTRAWNLFKGIAVVLLFALFAGLCIVHNTTAPQRYVQLCSYRLLVNRTKLMVNVLAKTQFANLCSATNIS